MPLPTADHSSALCACSHTYAAVSTLFDAHAALLADAVTDADADASAARREHSLTLLRIGLRRQLQIDEEILLPVILQVITSRLHAGETGETGAADRALFEHVRADHAGCLALLDRLDQTPADLADSSDGSVETSDHGANHVPAPGPTREAVMAVLAAYAMPHMQEVINLCPRLAAAGVDTRDLQRRMAERQLSLSEGGRSHSG